MQTLKIMMKVERKINVFDGLHRIKIEIYTAFKLTTIFFEFELGIKLFPIID